MHYAIIAAGLGQRLFKEGIMTPKPLIKIGKETLIDRLIRIFRQNEAEHISIICNTASQQLIQHLEQLTQAIPEVSFVVADTPSSMHSFHQLTKNTPCAQQPFCLTTVDTLFYEDNFAEYIKRFKQALAQPDIDGLFAITSFIHDEKPLYVQCDNQQNIKAFTDTTTSCTTISAGIYGLTPKTIPILNLCIERGESRMRNFQRALLQTGTKLKAYDIGTVIDIDHESDIHEARRLLHLLNK